MRPLALNRISCRRVKRFLLSVTVVLSVVAVALGGVALSRSGQKASGSTLRAAQARIAKLETEVANLNKVAGAQHILISRINTCLPEFWQYVNSAQLQQDNNGNTYINWGQQLVSICTRYLTGY